MMDRRTVLKAITITGAAIPLSDALAGTSQEIEETGVESGDMPILRVVTKGDNIFYCDNYRVGDILVVTPGGHHFDSVHLMRDGTFATICVIINSDDYGVYDHKTETRRMIPMDEIDQHVFGRISMIIRPNPSYITGWQTIWKCST